MLELYNVLKNAYVHKVIRPNTKNFVLSITRSKGKTKIEKLIEATNEGFKLNGKRLSKCKLRERKKRKSPTSHQDEGGLQTILTVRGASRLVKPIMK